MVVVGTEQWCERSEKCTLVAVCGCVGRLSGGYRIRLWVGADVAVRELGAGGCMRACVAEG